MLFSQKIKSFHKNVEGKQQEKKGFVGKFVFRQNLIDTKRITSCLAQVGSLWSPQLFPKTILKLVLLINVIFLTSRA